MKANGYPSPSIPDRFCIEASNVIAEAIRRDTKERTKSMAELADQINDLQKLIEEA